MTARRAGPAATGAAAGPASRIVRWQQEFGRHGLPWQGTRDAYRVWLSEVMLQQTQVATVLDYYPRFLARFPTVQVLAEAPLDDVLALWSGLGYYSRARHLHDCARQVAWKHGGEFPGGSVELARLPGIGRSTAAAIAAFCHGERAAILDGNVKRVLTRWLGFDGDLALAAQEKRLWAAAEALLPARDVDVYTQGLMDLGATVCLSRKPDCERCPLHADCAAHLAGRTEDYPVRTRRLVRGRRENALLWLQQRGRWWLVQRPPRGVWAGLWTLPQYDSREALAQAAEGWAGQGRWLPAVQHALTHFDWTLHPLAWQLPSRARALPDLPPGRWAGRDEALALGLPAPVRRLLESSLS